MIFAVIFAGGTGRRMHTTSRPKQFLEYQGKPIIIYTLPFIVIAIISQQQQHSRIRIRFIVFITLKLFLYD